jgi:hypothetical protein
MMRAEWCQCEHVCHFGNDWARKVRSDGRYKHPRPDGRPCHPYGQVFTGPMIEMGSWILCPECARYCHGKRLPNPPPPTALAGLEGQRFPRGVRSTYYRRGDVLWHGTSHVTGIVDLVGPMWVSNSRDVARWFSTWKLGSAWDGKLPVSPQRAVPRLLKLEVIEPFSLPTLEARGCDDFSNFAEWLVALTGDEDLREGGDMDEFAHSMCGTSYVGWRVVMNYHAGDDILICHPEHYLRRVPARGDWRP